MSEYSPDATQLQYTVSNETKEALISAVERIENLKKEIEIFKGEIKGVNDDIREIYNHAKSFGLDQATIKKIIAERAAGTDKIDEEKTMMRMYKDMLGYNTEEA